MVDLSVCKHGDSVVYFGRLSALGGFSLQHSTKWSVCVCVCYVRAEGEKNDGLIGHHKYFCSLFRVGVSDPEVGGLAFVVFSLTHRHFHS